MTITIPYMLLVAHFIIVLGSLYALIKDGSKPVRVWAWILVILFIPVLGAMMYYFFGVNLRKRKMFNLKKVIDYHQYEAFLMQNWKEIEPKIKKKGKVTKTYLNLIRLLARINGSLPTFNNNVTILNDGPETFEAIFEACEKAQKYIHLQYYIFIDGDLADRFANIFERKIQEGVKVRLIYDHVGSWEISKAYLQRLKDIGVEAHAFMPVRFGAMARVNYRNHRKILIVDGKVGFTGGINVDDKYIHGDPLLGHWTDTHVQLEGKSVNFLHFVFLCDWQFVTKQNLIRRDFFDFEDHPIGQTPVQIVYGGPDTDYHNVLQQYLYILNQANDYVYIVNPYIVPDSTLRMTLNTVALSGVDVRIVVPANSESALIYWTVRSFFSEMLKAGIKIYLFRDGFIHSKLVLSDDVVCSIGTANLDVRSLEQNFEVNALIYEKDTTLKLKHQFEKFVEQSDYLHLDHFRQRPSWEKTKEKLARLTSPLM